MTHVELVARPASVNGVCEFRAIAFRNLMATGIF